MPCSGTRSSPPLALNDARLDGDVGQQHQTGDQRRYHRHQPERRREQQLGQDQVARRPEDLLARRYSPPSSKASRATSGPRRLPLSGGVRWLLVDGQSAAQTYHLPRSSPPRSVVSGLVSGSGEISPRFLNPGPPDPANVTSTNADRAARRTRSSARPRAPHPATPALRHRNFRFQQRPASTDLVMGTPKVVYMNWTHLLPHMRSNFCECECGGGVQP